MKVKGFLGNTETTLRLTEELQDYFPDIDQDTIMQVLFDSGNDLAIASGRLQDIEDQMEQGERAEAQPVVHFSKKELKLRKKLDKLFPSATCEIVNDAIAEYGNEMTKIVCKLVPICGLPMAGKYRKIYNQLKLLYPELDNDTVVLLLIETGFDVNQINEELLRDPAKRHRSDLRTVRHIKQLQKRFPNIIEEEIRGVLELCGLDYNKALATLKASKSNTNEERARTLHKRLLDLYGSQNSETLLDIARAAEYDLKTALKVCTELFGPPNHNIGTQPLSHHNLRSSIKQGNEPEIGFMPDREFADKKFEMDALRVHFKELDLRAKDLRDAGFREEAKVVADESKIAKRKHNLAYKEIYEETFRRNNLRKDINSLDLHGLKPEEAIAILDSYFDVMETVVRDQGLTDYKLTIITGWGRHNVSQTSILKTKAAQLMMRRKMCFYEHNKGSYEVVLNPQ